MAAKVRFLINMMRVGIVTCQLNIPRSSKQIYSSRDGGSKCKVWWMDVEVPLQKVENRVLPSYCRIPDLPEILLIGSAHIRGAALPTWALQIVLKVGSDPTKRPVCIYFHCFMRNFG
jgi:hypothetical protein